ncbi:MAG: 16S rRNA (cytosine(967)-C(5))-methyltransferase RsmB [Betaproteobacteria bacterium]|jgi:16S rRNA (cytosine967-C5)-methyltransferase|nr:16S rRNA (cytosine(967)-C(5))-methyltransferase RsmB [Betaproteobacteria bacterium]
MDDLQCLAAQTISRVLAGRSLDAELAALWRSHAALAAQQRGAVQDMAYGTLRHLGMIDALIDRLLARPLTDDAVRPLLQVAIYQLGHTRAHAYTVVDHAVRATARLGAVRAKGLVNAVLRNYLRRRPELESAVRSNAVARYSYPQWWIDRLAAEQPEHWRSILEAGNTRPPLTLRVNRREISRDDYLARLLQADIPAAAVGRDGVIIEKPRPVTQLPGFAEGLVSVQDAGAQLAAQLLDVSDGMRVLDACAAPGGKTAHLLECATLDLTAADNDGERLQRVADNLARLKLKATLIKADAGDLRVWKNTAPFDCILADVPCTASGVVRRHPDIKWLRRPGDIAAMALQQSRILDVLLQLLGRGGKLLYATCSVFAAENGRQIEDFRARHPDARQLAMDVQLEGLNHSAGQLFPDAQHDGFFYALLEKA